MAKVLFMPLAANFPSHTIFENIFASPTPITRIRYVISTIHTRAVSVIPYASMKSRQGPDQRCTVRKWDWLRFYYTVRCRRPEAGLKLWGQKGNLKLDRELENAGVPNEPSPISGHSPHLPVRNAAWEGPRRIHASRFSWGNLSFQLLDFLKRRMYASLYRT
jgi:hypothetical protein